MASQENPRPWINPGKWITSPFNYEPEIRGSWQLPSRVTVHDVTLRDGEQWPGVVLRKDEKLRIAHALEDAGIHRIEGGMASVSEEDAEAIAAMSRELKTAEISSLVRARHDDLELAIKCGVQRVIMEVPTLPEQIQRIWGGMEKTVEAYVRETEFAAQNGVKVTLFLMESTRSNLPLLKELVGSIVRQGKVESVAVVDTRGVAVPQTISWLVSAIKSVANVPVEIHAHNVWGLGTAATLAAVMAGAEVIHAAVNGLNGNAALEECVMGVHGLLGVDTGVRTETFTSLSQLVKEHTKVDFYKPFLGPGVAQVEVGIAIRFMWDMRDRPGYGRGEIMNYEVVGGKMIEVVLGKKSGTYSVLLKAWEMGLPLPEKEAAQQILTQIKDLAQREKRLVTEEEFLGFYRAATGGAAGGAGRGQ